MGIVVSHDFAEEATFTILVLFHFQTGLNMWCNSLLCPHHLLVNLEQGRILRLLAAGACKRFSCNGPFTTRVLVWVALPILSLQSFADTVRLSDSVLSLLQSHTGIAAVLTWWRGRQWGRAACEAHCWNCNSPWVPAHKLAHLVGTKLGTGDSTEALGLVCAPLTPPDP